MGPSLGSLAPSKGSKRCVRNLKMVYNGVPRVLQGFRARGPYSVTSALSWGYPDMLGSA